MRNPDEEWRPVPGHPGYEVSNHGRVRSLDRFVRGRYGLRLITGRTLRPRPHGGYVKFALTDRKEFLLHQLVALAFIGPQPDGTIVCHKDDEKHRSTPDNLYYGTYASNMRDAFLNGRLWAQRKSTANIRDRSKRNKYLKATGGRGTRYAKA